MIWRKLIRLAAISTITSIARKSLGSVRNNHELNMILKGIVDELCMIAETQNFILKSEVVLSQIEELPESLTTSMQRDIQAGKKSEIEAILGNTIRLGKSKGLIIPQLEKCYMNLTKYEK